LNRHEAPTNEEFIVARKPVHEDYYRILFKELAFATIGKRVAQCIVDLLC
jgi:hypothetical protein